MTWRQPKDYRMMLNMAESARKLLLDPDCRWKVLEATEGYKMMLNVAESVRKFLVAPGCC